MCMENIFKPTIDAMNREGRVWVVYTLINVSWWCKGYRIIVGWD